jgi:chromosome segregation ATPase
VSTAQHLDRSYASKSNNDSNSSASKSGDSNKHKQPEGAILGLSKLKRKLAEIDKERELYKVEQTKMEDEISTVTNSLSKLGDQMIEMRQDMTALSGSLRTELAEMKQILLGMSKKTPSPRRKTHRRAKESEAASSSSSDEIMAAASTSPTEQDSRWDSMCESGAEQSGRSPPVTVTLATLEDFDMNGVDTSIRKSDRDKRKVRDPNTHIKPSEASPTGVY